MRMSKSTYDGADKYVRIFVNGVYIGSEGCTKKPWYELELPEWLREWLTDVVPHVDLDSGIKSVVGTWIGDTSRDSDTTRKLLGHLRLLQEYMLPVATPEQLKEILTESEQEQLRKKTVKVGGYFQIDIEQCLATNDRLSGWELTVTAADPLNHPVEKHMFISRVEVGDKLGLVPYLPKLVVTDYRSKEERESELRFSN